MSEEGRVFFSNVGRSLEEEDEIRLLSVGVDIGSSTSHLVFSRIVLERMDNRYVVAERSLLHESEVMLTPYREDASIDAAALGRFIERQYALAEIAPAQIDTGALILTGVAVRRSNARAIGELFAAQAGKFVSVSAGDALEATLAAFGSGAAARSIRETATVMNIDIGGGTSKIAVCQQGAVTTLTAIDIGARIVCFDEGGRVSRVEPAAAGFAAAAGLQLEVGAVPDAALLQAMVELMAERLMQAARGADAEAEAGLVPLLRLEPLAIGAAPAVLTFSGGVSEYIYGREGGAFGDLGPALARAVLARARRWGPRIEAPDQGIRATVVGASQYTVQVSGSTVFIAPAALLPLKNIAVLTPQLALEDEVLDADALAAAVRTALRQFDLQQGEQAVALCYRWQGSASFARLDAFCRAMVAGLAELLERGLPLVLVGDSDVGGLVGMHCRQELALACPIVSIDGITLKAFDYIDIGALLPASGAVPVVIKSLVFPASAAPGLRADAAGRLQA